MSATGRRKAVGDPTTYRANGAYETPLPLARALVDVLPGLDTPQLVLEPSVGGGAFVEAILAREGRTRSYHRVMGIDVDADAPGLALVAREGGWAAVGDFLTCSLPKRPSLIVGNPPYAIPGEGAPAPAAEAHIRRALAVVAPGGMVAFLLRLAMLESAARLPLWREYPAHTIHVLAQRPSFTSGGTDSAAYGFFLWREGWTGDTILRVLDWRTA